MSDLIVYCWFSNLAAGWQNNNPAAFFPGEGETIVICQITVICQKVCSGHLDKNRKSSHSHLCCEHLDNRELSGAHLSLLPALFLLHPGTVRVRKQPHSSLMTAYPNPQRLSTSLPRAPHVYTAPKASTLKLVVWSLVTVAQLGANRSSRETRCFLVAFSKLPGQFWLLSWVVHSPITVLSVRNSVAPSSAAQVVCALCLCHFLLGAVMLKAILSSCFSRSSRVPGPSVPKSLAAWAADKAKRQSSSFCSEAAQRLAQLFLVPDSELNHL